MKVKQIDKDTLKVIKTFDTINEASKELRIDSDNIVSVCKGNRPLTAGYMWSFVKGDDTIE